MGQKLGPYQIESIIGQGGVSVVYRARRPDDSLVALKILFTPPASEAIIKERFEREARVASRLRHPGIVHVLDYGALDGHTYMAMNLIEGRSLSDYLIEVSRLDEAKAASIGWQIADALYYAHQHHVIHRDVKPSNILITKDALVSLIDLGIVLALDDPSLTETGRLIGTPVYISPEQAAANQKIDGRADLYSLGVVMYRLVTGRTPFRGSAPEVLHAQIHEAPPDPSQFAPISAEMQAFLKKALAKNPDNRFQTGAEMARALAQLSNRPPEIPKPTPTPPEPQAKPWALFFLGGLGLLFAALLVLGRLN